MKTKKTRWGTVAAWSRETQIASHVLQARLGNAETRIGRQGERSVRLVREDDVQAATGEQVRSMPVVGDDGFVML